MFLLRRPSQPAIDEFRQASEQLPLSYDPIGIAISRVRRGNVDEQVVPIGSGMEDFERARSALTSWQHLDIGWLAVHPQTPDVAAGAVVAVLVHHLGFWSLNACRVLYTVEPVADDCARFGFAYGTLTNHAESGEELFEVFVEPDGRVMYRIRAVSWPRAALAQAGYPVVRWLQARFRRDSASAMKRALTKRDPQRGG